MSYEEKYLKYKSKYLALKALKNNLEQLGGSKINTKSIYNDSFLNLNSLTETPVHNQSGGKRKPYKIEKGKKRSIWDDSDMNLSSSTDTMSISELHSLSSCDIEDI